MMKIINLTLFFIIIITLTGCNERELTFDRIYPDTAKLDEYREKRQLEIEEEIKNSPTLVLETRPKPRSLLINEPIVDIEPSEELDPSESLEPIEPNKINVSSSQFCWDYNYLDCDARVKPQHPYDIPLLALVDVKSVISSTNEVLQIFMELDRGSILPYPTRIEAYIYDLNKNLHLYQTVEDTTDIMQFELTSPSEPGSYMFLIKVFYKGEVQGVSYHPFKNITK